MLCIGLLAQVERHVVIDALLQLLWGCFPGVSVEHETAAVLEHAGLHVQVLQGQARFGHLAIAQEILHVGWIFAFAAR